MLSGAKLPSEESNGAVQKNFLYRDKKLTIGEDNNDEARADVSSNKR